MELELTIETKDSGAVVVQRLPLNGRIVLGRGPESPVALEGAQISRDHIAFAHHIREPLADVQNQFIAHRMPQ